MDSPRPEHEKTFKIKYTDGDHKLNLYCTGHLSPSYNKLVELLHERLFKGRMFPKCELRIYWIDEVSDEIDVFNNLDYGLFLRKCGAKNHLFVVPTVVKTKEPNYPADCVIHEKKAEHADVSSEQPKTNGQPTTKQ